MASHHPMRHHWIHPGLLEALLAKLLWLLSRNLCIPHGIQISCLAVEHGLRHRLRPHRVDLHGAELLCYKHVKIIDLTHELLVMQLLVLRLHLHHLQLV